MKKKIVLCPNCSSAIHVSNAQVECQYCGERIGRDNEELSIFLEGVLEKSYEEDNLLSMWENC